MFLLRERMGAFPEALAEAEWLCERYPENLRYMFWRGVSLKRIGKLAEARPVLEKVVSLSSRSAEARQALADVYYREQNLPRAQALLEEALRMDPLSAAVAVDLGNVYLALGTPEKAEKVLTTAVGMHPNQAPVHFSLALALAERDRARALNHARKAAAARDPRLRVEAEKLIAQLTPGP
jgi:tetratricopeptide (TPR) repeat protein